LYDLSKRAAEITQSKYPGLAEMLVPLSMALLTTYDKEYLGAKAQENESDTEKSKD